MMFVRLSVLSGRTCIFDHTVHFSTNLSLWLDSPVFCDMSFMADDLNKNCPIITTLATLITQIIIHLQEFLFPTSPIQCNCFSLQNC